MKPVFLLGLAFALPLHSQVPGAPPPSSPPPVSSPAASAQALRSAEDLETLLGPIALYPDALIGIILPASTTPADIVLAARFVGTANAPDANALASQPWDDSVKALAHYPDLLRWLDQNLTWTQALGEAFLAQPADVMNSVQRLRQQARAAGTLVDTPQQQVITEENALVIIHAQPDVIYVPVYDPTVVFISYPTRIRHHHLRFYSAYRCGPWLNYRPDWHHHHLRVIHHHAGHTSPYRDYRRPPSRLPGHVWSPAAHVRPRPHSQPHARFTQPSSRSSVIDHREHRVNPPATTRPDSFSRTETPPRRVRPVDPPKRQPPRVVRESRPEPGFRAQEPRPNQSRTRVEEPTPIRRVKPTPTPPSNSRNSTESEWATRNRGSR